MLCRSQQLITADHSSHSSSEDDSTATTNNRRREVVAWKELVIDAQHDFEHRADVLNACPVRRIIDDACHF